MFKKLFNYFTYRKFIDRNKSGLEKEFDLKIDRLYRLGHRVSIPERRYEVLVNYKNPEIDIFKNLDEETKKFISKMDTFFMKNGMSEFVGIYSAERTGVNQVTIIISYKFLNVVKLAVTTRVISIISAFSLLLGIIDIYYLIPGGSLIFLYFLSNKILFKKLFV